VRCIPQFANNGETCFARAPMKPLITRHSWSCYVRAIAHERMNGIDTCLRWCITNAKRDSRGGGLQVPSQDWKSLLPSAASVYNGPYLALFTARIRWQYLREEKAPCRHRLATLEILRIDLCLEVCPLLGIVVQMSRSASRTSLLKLDR